MSIDHNELDELVKKAHAIKDQIDQIDLTKGFEVTPMVVELCRLSKELGDTKDKIMEVLGL